MHGHSTISARSPWACVTGVLLVLLVAGTAASRGGASKRIKPRKAVSLERELAADKAQVGAMLSAARNATKAEGEALRAYLQQQPWHKKLLGDLNRLDLTTEAGQARRVSLLRQAQPSFAAAYKSQAPRLTLGAAAAASKLSRTATVRAGPAGTGGILMMGPPDSGSAPELAPGGAGAGPASVRLGSWNKLESFVGEGWEVGTEGPPTVNTPPDLPGHLNEALELLVGTYARRTPNAGSWDVQAMANSVHFKANAMGWAKVWGVRKVVVPAGYRTMRIKASATFQRIANASVTGAGFAYTQMKAQVQVSRGGSTWVASIDGEHLVAQSGPGHLEYDSPGASTSRDVDFTIDVDSGGGDYEVRFGVQVESEDNKFYPNAWNSAYGRLGLKVRDITIDLVK